MSKESEFIYQCIFRDGSEKLVSGKDLWWTIKFYQTVLFGVLYLVHVLGWAFSSIFTVVKRPVGSEMDELESANGQITGTTLGVSNHSEKLGLWLKKEKCPVVPYHKTILPIPEQELSYFVRFACIYYSHLKFHAAICSKGLQRPQNTKKIRNEVQCLIQSIQSSTKYSKLCHRLISFLTSFYNSTDQEILDFLSEVTTMIEHAPFAWFHRYCHAVARICDEDKYRSKAVTVFTSIFMSRNAHVLTFYLRKGYVNSDWFSGSVLQIIPWFATQYCGFSECDINDFKLLERRNGSSFESVHHLLFKSGKSFEPVISRYSAREAESLKATLQWDFAINLCNVLVDEDWDIDMMERAAWALGCGREYVSEAVFDLLHRNRLTPRIDFTVFDVQKLLALSASGLVQFKGFDACMFNLTANKHALFTVHGYLKKPTMEDLVKLKLFRQAKTGWFYACDFPGCASRHKGVPVGDRILIVQSTKNILFRADMSQIVG